jgi:hypothetical protein
LYAWVKHHAADSLKEREADSIAMAQRRQMYQDSLFLHDQVKLHPASRGDFYHVPFGVPRRAFTLLFFDTFSDLVMDDYDRLVVRGFLWDSTAYDLAFYFGAEDSLAWYQVESVSYSADSLELAGRPAVERLAAIFEKKLGPPQRLYRVGFFDISPNHLCPYMTWKGADFEVHVGFATYKYRYYAKAVVIRTARTASTAP